MTRRLSRVLLAVALAIGAFSSLSCVVPLGVALIVEEVFIDCGEPFEDFTPFADDDCSSDHGVPIPSVSPPPGPDDAVCAAPIDEDPAKFGVNILFVGDTSRTRKLYTVWKDLELLGSVVPPFRVTDESGELHAEGDRPFLKQDDLHVDYHIERPGAGCASHYQVNCSSANDRACLLSVPQLGLVRIITPDLDELLNVYAPDDEAILNMTLRLTKLAEVYIHEGAHVYAPHVKPGLDLNVHGPFGAGLIASTGMLTAIWDVARRASPEAAGPFSGIRYDELLTTVGETRVLEAYRLNRYTLQYHVVDQVAVVRTLLPLVHRDFQNAFVEGDPDDVVGRVEGRYLNALVEAAY